MSPPPCPPKRRWLQFRLATLFVLAFIVSVPLAVRAWREQRYREQFAAVKLIVGYGGKVGVQGPTYDVATCAGWVMPDTGAGAIYQCFELRRDDAVVFAWSGLSSSPEKELSAISRFPRLKMLHLGASDVTDAQLAVVAKMSSIEDLNLQLTGVTDDGIRRLAPLRSLRSLTLWKTRVTGAGFKDLSCMQKLKKLDLHESEFDDEGVRHLACLRSLRVLDLSNECNRPPAGLGGEGEGYIVVQ